MFFFPEKWTMLNIVFRIMLTECTFMAWKHNLFIRLEIAHWFMGWNSCLSTCFAYWNWFLLFRLLNNYLEWFNRGNTYFRVIIEINSRQFFYPAVWLGVPTVNGKWTMPRWRSRECWGGHVGSPPSSPSVLTEPQLGGTQGQSIQPRCWGIQRVLEHDVFFYVLYVCSLILSRLA